MKDLKKIIIILAIVLTCVILLLVLKQRKVQGPNINNNSSSTISNEDLEPVKSATAFFTVQDCVNKYLSYVQDKNSEAVFKVLDSGYKQDSNITEKNVLNKK